MRTARFDAEASAGPDEDRGRNAAERRRRCLATGVRADRGAMIRFVVAPDGVVTPDLKAVLPGRGMWLSADRRSVNTALKRNLFSRAARRPLSVPEDLEARLEALLCRRCVEWLARANRAGQAVCGFEKTRAALTRFEGALLLTACDGADNGRRKLATAARTATPVDILTAAEIGGAFGRDAVVHAMVAPGGLADGLAADAARLAGFRVRDCVQTAPRGAMAGKEGCDDRQ